MKNGMPPGAPGNIHKATSFVFFGSPEFAADVLTRLIKGGFEPTLVVTNPDRPFGRRQIVTPPPVRRVIADRGENIPVLQPESLEDARDELLHLTPDFFVVAAYGKIIPKNILSIPRLGAIGVHPSLLPQYRGPTPIQTAMLEGERETGVTLYLMDEKLDHGPILRSQKIEVRDQNYRELERELAERGADLLIEILPKFLRGEIKPESQDETLVTYTRKFTSDDGFVDPENLEAALAGRSEADAAAILRKIRALNPEPGIWTKGWSPYGEKRVKLLEAAREGRKLMLKKIQLEGKRPRAL